MNTYYVDFRGFTEIEAKDREEAIMKFWTMVTDCPQGTLFEIETVEEIRED